MELLFCVNTTCIIPSCKEDFIIPYPNVWAQFYFSVGSTFLVLEGKSRQPLYFFWGGGWGALPQCKDILRVAQPRLCDWKFSLDQKRWQVLWVWSKRLEFKVANQWSAEVFCLPLTMFRNFKIRFQDLKNGRLQINIQNCSFSWKLDKYGSFLAWLHAALAD